MWDLNDARRVLTIFVRLERSSMELVIERFFFIVVAVSLVPLFFERYLSANLSFCRAGYASKKKNNAYFRVSFEGSKETIGESKASMGEASSMRFREGKS